MDNKSRTEKEIKAYKIRTIIFLIIILILTIIAIWQFLELQKKYVELRDKTNIIALKDSIIGQQAIIKQQKLEIDTAIMLLSILVSEEDGQTMEPEAVLEGLNELAAQVREDRAKYRARRADLILDLFSGSETTRENARRSLLKEYSDDKNLTNRMFNAAAGKINLDNQNSIYQILYILEQISFQNLQNNKSGITKFLDDAEAAGLIGPQTLSRVNDIRDRLNE